MVGNNKIIQIDSVSTGPLSVFEGYLRSDGSFNHEQLSKDLQKIPVNHEQLSKDLQKIPVLDITLPSKFIKTNCMLRVESQGNFFYLDWDLKQKAPVSEFMDASDWVVYMDEWYKDYLPKDGVEPSELNPIVYVAMDPTHIDKLIFNNHAGPAGETLTLFEIVNHYGNSMKNRVPVPLNQDEDTENTRK